MSRALAWACLIVLAACPGPQGVGGHTPEWITDTTTFSSRIATPSSPPTVVDQYGDTARKIITAGRTDRGAYTKLAELTDTIGHRLAGSPQLDKAIAWAVGTLKAEGHDARTEKVMVPTWVRGAEEAAIVTPVATPLHILGLGGTIATPKDGITAPIVVVTSFDDLDAKASEVKGAIVVYNVAMPAYSEENGSGYGEVVKYRGQGASRAAKHGAVAALVRSVTAHSLRTPHTGAMGYAPGAPKIPAASITVEDATLLARLAARGPVTVKLRLEAQTLPDVESANVIGELRGSTQPDEVVVIGGHLDSWDVGQGAHDDGAGCVMMMQAITLLKQLGLRPRRTIRVVLFTNEENGLRGAKAYAKDHAGEMANHVFALEADSGGFSPRGITVEAKAELGPRALNKLAEIVRLLEPVGVTWVKASHSGADVGQMVPLGVVAAGLVTDGRTYFDYHHTAADTFDKIDPQQLADNVAAVAALAYIIADMPDRL